MVTLQGHRIRSILYDMCIIYVYVIESRADTMPLWLPFLQYTTKLYKNVVTVQGFLCYCERCSYM